MSKFKLPAFLVLIFSVLFLTTGCISFNSGGGEPTGPVGGVFKSGNKGLNWEQKGLIATTDNKRKSITNLSAASLALDPSDHKAVYYGSVGNGLFYSYDGGNSWHKANGLGNATIRKVAIDPASKCTIYATAGNKIFQSTDCNRTYEQIYFDNQQSVTLDALVIDHYDPNNVYVGLSRGDIIKSADRGSTWTTIFRQDKGNNKVLKIAIDPNDSRHIYAVIKGKGIYRSLDSGENWAEMEELNSQLKEFNLTKQIEHLSFVDGEEDIIYVATSRGMLRSADGGEVWEQIEIIPPEKKAAINDVAVNPHNSEEIFYITKNTFFSSLNGGDSWKNKKLPTSGLGQLLLIDPEEPNILYVGVKVPKG